MDKLNTSSLIAFCAVLLVGVGGSLGAVALDAKDLSTAILAFSAGLLVPLGNSTAK